MMWSNLPSDLVSKVFSYLPPHFLARAMATCRHWHHCGRSTTTLTLHQHPPWFIALPNRTNFCFLQNQTTTTSTWHLLNLEHVPSSSRPVSTIAGHGLILFKSTGSVLLQLSVCNPFTGQCHHLPPLRKPRTNPAVGVIEEVDPPRFKVYVAGGMSAGGAGSYEPTLEMFDSRSNTWTLVGSIPVEFAVRLTVWTPNESVYSDEVLYWMTSARAYSIMGFEINTGKWREVSVPRGDTLEFAAMVPRDGKVMVIGGTHGGDVTVWELGECRNWNVIERMPVELGKRLMTGGGTKCVGMEGVVCLYSNKDIGKGMVVWRRDNSNNNNNKNKNRWEWHWIGGCDEEMTIVSGKQGLQNWAAAINDTAVVKGLFLHPNLASSSSSFF